MKTTSASYHIIPPTPPPNSSSSNSNRIQYKPKPSLHTPHPKHLTPPHLSTTLTVAEKLNILVSEFKSLPKPIDRVKRLIHYASLLPELEQSCKVEPNRVTGCTAQVWLEVVMEDDGTMRFRVDSDSEITKGFCYCLVWLLDGAAADDVVEVRVDDLSEMNVGVLPVRVSSRVITWHNVLLSMQTRTRDLVMESSTS
ncbi:putative Fe-S metabolism associated domain, SufE [Helianthus annuus]|uniref:Fe-S metabolism associated domain, SufE n=1 Tax=Helianthus annuus TaxID=4232 RepID=A0A251RMN0_HELAN|nr:sufE-like protein 2, chloroplastic [Helianthus annuus]KAF5754105.1 putative Fe-S metabolism associated domain, SufE [Helianthus annuus]KAJ0811871.1 putative Fe-S metabolism associated domain, SufE [Helianthus annuus]